MTVNEAKAIYNEWIEAKESFDAAWERLEASLRALRTIPLSFDP